MSSIRCSAVTVRKTTCLNKAKVGGLCKIHISQLRKSILSNLRETPLGSPAGQITHKLSPQQFELLNEAVGKPFTTQVGGGFGKSKLSNPAMKRGTIIHQITSAACHRDAVMLCNRLPLDQRSVYRPELILAIRDEITRLGFKPHDSHCVYNRSRPDFYHPLWRIPADLKTGVTAWNSPQYLDQYLSHMLGMDCDSYVVVNISPENVKQYHRDRRLEVFFKQFRL